MTFKNSYRFSFLKINTIIISFLSTKKQTASSRNSNRNDAVFYFLLLRNRRMGLSRWFSREHSGPGRQLYNELARILCISLDRTVACATRYGTYWTTLWVVGNNQALPQQEHQELLKCRSAFQSAGMNCCFSTQKL